MQKQFLKSAVLAVTTLLSGPLCLAQQIPKTELTTLDGVRLVIPKDANSKPLLLLLTFSHKGADDAAAWNKQFKAAYASDRRIDYYELSDFQGVPPFVMKMILHGMRRSVKEPERARSAPFYTQEENWKSLVHYDDPKIGYLLLTQTRGPANEPKAAELEKAITKLLSR